MVVVVHFLPVALITDVISVTVPALVGGEVSSTQASTKPLASVDVKLSPAFLN